MSAPTSRTKKDIKRLAEQIYRLIRSCRDDEAYQELLALESDAIPVANALISGEFRVSPLKIAAGSSGCLFMLLFPLVSTSLLCKRLGIPPYLNSGVGQVILRFGIAGVLYFLEVCLTGSVIGVNDRNLRKHKLKHPSFRVHEIASKVLVEATSGSPEQIGGLLLASRVDPEPSTETLAALDAALISHLNSAEADTLRGLTSSHIEAMRPQLWGFAHDLGAISRSDRDSATSSPARPEGTQIALGTAMLRAFEYIPDTGVTSTVREISTLEITESNARWRPMIEAARRTLPLLEENLKRANSGRDLLRGSSDQIAGGELLRAHVSQVGVNADELLRATNSEEE